jgi:hypothetical protein
MDRWQAVEAAGGPVEEVGGGEGARAGGPAAHSAAFGAGVLLSDARAGPAGGGSQQGADPDTARPAWWRLPGRGGAATGGSSRGATAGS